MCASDWETIEPTKNGKKKKHNSNEARDFLSLGPTQIIEIHFINKYIYKKKILDVCASDWETVSDFTCPKYMCRKPKLVNFVRVQCFVFDCDACAISMWSEDCLFDFIVQADVSF